MVADDLEECRTTAAWLSKHQNHFTRLSDALEVLEDVEFLALLAQAKDAGGRLENIEEGYESIGESLAEASVGSIAYKRRTSYLDIILHPTYMSLLAFGSQLTGCDHTNATNGETVPHDANALGLDAGRFFFVATTPQCSLEIELLIRVL